MPLTPSRSTIGIAIYPGTQTWAHLLCSLHDLPLPVVSCAGRTSEGSSVATPTFYSTPAVLGSDMAYSHTSLAAPGCTNPKSRCKRHVHSLPGNLCIDRAVFRTDSKPTKAHQVPSSKERRNPAPGSPHEVSLIPAQLITHFGLPWLLKCTLKISLDM